VPDVLYPNHTVCV